MDKTLADKLTEMKKDAGLSNRRISELTGIPEGTVNNIFSGNTVKPSFEDVSAIVSAMGRDVSELCGEQPQPTAQVVTAVLDHSALLIESYKDQIRYQRRVQWVLIAILVAMIAFMCYLCVDAAHGNWGLIQYPVQ